MTTRITGLISGLDVDSLVKAGVSRYQSKLDKAKAQEQILEWKQEQYRAISTSVSDFNNKYLDPTSSNSLLMSSNWSTAAFTSSNSSAVSAAATTSTANPDNYTVNVTQLASVATTTLSSSSDYSGGITVTSGSKSYTLNGTDITGISGWSSMSESQKGVAVAGLLTTKFGSGSGLTATYSQLSGGIVLKTTALGGDSSFTLSTTNSSSSTTSKTYNGTYLNATITNGSGTVYTMNDTTNKTSANTTTLDGVQFTFNNTTSSSKAITTSSISSILGSNITSTAYTLSNGKQITIASDGTTVNVAGGSGTTITNSDGSTTTITGSGSLTTTTAAKQITNTSINGLLGNYITSSNTINNYALSDGNSITIGSDGSVQVFDNSGNKLANADTFSITNGDGSTTAIKGDGSFKTVASDGLTVTSSGYINSLSIGNALGNDITKIGTSNEYTLTTNKYKLSDGTTDSTSAKITIGTDGSVQVFGSDGKAITGSISVTNADGSTSTITSGGSLTTTTAPQNITSTSINSLLGSNITSTSYTLTDGSNINIDASSGKVTVKDKNNNTLGSSDSMSITNSDGSKTIIKGDGTATTAGDPVTLAGSTDTTALQTKIESFMKDYNTLMTTINGKIYESYDSSYQPLTDDQKTSMSSDQITKWETKAQTGLLHNDEYLQSLASDMKQTMSSFMSSTGIDLEAIGIKPVQNYDSSNGTYNVDSSALKSALNGGLTRGGKTITVADIQSLFTNANSNSTTTKSSTGDGVLAQLKVALNNNVMKSGSQFQKVAGVTGTTSEYTNEITSKLKDQTTLIDTLTDQLNTQEDALYLKYSNLETQLSNLKSSSSVFSSSSSS